MKPFYIKLTNKTSLMVIPDTEAHLDGHPLITHTYSIFLNNGQPEPQQSSSKKDTLHLSHHDDPNYRGEISFEMPGKLFNYRSEGRQRLSTAEVEELIGELSERRDNPSSWNDMDTI